jgi:hypothetical protein
VQALLNSTRNLSLPTKQEKVASAESAAVGQNYPAERTFDDLAAPNSSKPDRPAMRASSREHCCYKLMHHWEAPRLITERENGLTNTNVTLGRKLLGPVAGEELSEFGQCFVPGFAGRFGSQGKLRFPLQQSQHLFRAGLPYCWNSVSLNNVEGRNHIVPFSRGASGPNGCYRWSEGDEGKTSGRSAARPGTCERALSQPRWRTARLAGALRQHPCRR